jgi:hypothetical protein
VRAILIGSRAYKQTDFGDTDILCDREWKDAWEERRAPVAGHDGGIYEITSPRDGSAHAELLRGSDAWPDVRADGADEGDWLHGLPLRRTPVAFLAALKKAHLILPSGSPWKWRRQMEEYCALKALLRASSEVAQFNGCIWSPRDGARRIFERHRAECLERQRRPPKLNQSKAAFFGAEGYEVFDHDSIHEALAHPRSPAYLQIKSGEVRVSRTKWRALDDAEKLRCAVEEAGILALERSILPHLFLGRDYRGMRWAYEHALFRICTTITSGEFRDWCLENWERIRDASPDLASKFFEGVRLGIVKVARPERLWRGAR